MLYDIRFGYFFIRFPLSAYNLDPLFSALVLHLFYFGRLNIFFAFYFICNADCYVILIRLCQILIGSYEILNVGFDMIAIM